MSFVVVLAASFGCVTAHAWGRMGHAVVAYIAESRLAPETQRRVFQLLSTDRSSLADPLDLGDEANWADRYRDSDGRGEAYRVTHHWHFVDLDRRHPNLDRACFGRLRAHQGPVASKGPEHACIVDKLVQFRAVLDDPAAASEERLRALQFVLHLSGDIHQPMHAITDSDAGGNDRKVALEHGHVESLHHLWDTTLVERISPLPINPHDKSDWREHAHAIADALLARRDEAAIVSDGSDVSATTSLGSIDTRFDPESWAWESHQLARVHAYGRLRGSGPPSIDRLGKRYEVQAEAIVALQLTRAGLRLARLLNETLGSTEDSMRDRQRD